MIVHIIYHYRQFVIVATKEVIRNIYLDRLLEFKDHVNLVKIITGVRRCGKSTLMGQYINRLKNDGITSERILYLNLESANYKEIENHEDLIEFTYHRLPKKERSYLFLDEIQRVDQWEKAVNSLMVDRDVDIYITGSNAHLLSSELSTYLTGRYVSVNMFPLSFKEYCELHSDLKFSEEELFDRYIRYGGFPGIDIGLSEMSIHTSLSDLYASILYWDVMARGEIRNRPELDKLTSYLMMNIGNPISINSIVKGIGNIRRETVERYLNLLEESYVIYRADRFDLKSTVLSPTPKYYSIDTGIRNASLIYKDEDYGRLMENVVYLELLRRGYAVQVGKYGSEEIDFAARKGMGGWEYFQVSYSIKSEETRKREFRPLRELNNSFPKTVITTDHRMSSVTEDGIKHVHIINWLLEQD